MIGAEHLGGGTRHAAWEQSCACALSRRSNQPGAEHRGSQRRPLHYSVNHAYTEMVKGYSGKAPCSRIFFLGSMGRHGTGKVSCVLELFSSPCLGISFALRYCLTCVRVCAMLPFSKRLYLPCRNGLIIMVHRRYECITPVSSIPD